jgi:hypothetical protein
MIRSKRQPKNQTAPKSEQFQNCDYVVAVANVGKSENDANECCQPKENAFIFKSIQWVIVIMFVKRGNDARNKRGNVVKQSSANLWYFLSDKNDVVLCGFAAL